MSKYYLHAVKINDLAHSKILPVVPVEVDEQDTKRLDWLQENGGDLSCQRKSNNSDGLVFSIATGLDDNGWPIWSRPNDSIREAIDDAMRKEAPPK
jgi:hypothetical protein